MTSFENQQLGGGRGGAITSADPNGNENIEQKSSVKSVGADQIKRALPKLLGWVGGGGQAPSAPPHATALRKKSLEPLADH